tara:strand:- start:279 stop:761 length:483 start_codon:yes stop_codon:yes gene_type:complete
MYILIKGREDKPPNPRILVGDEEMKLSKWANRKAAEMMRAEGKAASGPEWEARRNSLIEEVKANPDTHGISFLGGAPEGFATGGPREATDIPEPVETQDTANVGDRADVASLPPHQSFLPSSEEDEDEEPKKDPQQSSLFDFGMKMKSQAMNHAWNYLNN